MQFSFSNRPGYGVIPYPTSIKPFGDAARISGAALLQMFHFPGIVLD